MRLARGAILEPTLVAAQALLDHQERLVGAGGHAVRRLVDAELLVDASPATTASPPIAGTGRRWILRADGRSTAPMRRASARTIGVSARLSRLTTVAIMAMDQTAKNLPPMISSDSTGAQTDVMLEPFAHYNIVRLKQDVLANSYVGAIFTSVAKTSRAPG